MGNETFNTGLTDAQRERLARLLEERGEVQQIIGKVLRHGFDIRTAGRRTGNCSRRKSGTWSSPQPC